ncbi:MAG TPA: DUF1003 domain-containing protein [Prosthecobacter sp.]|nr:DUF1003 domain-containing protein [Prosthecobacter sp.]
MSTPTTTGAAAIPDGSRAHEVPCSLLNPSLLQFIQKRHSDQIIQGNISADALAVMKADFVEEALREELGEITDLERAVIESMREHELISSNPGYTQAAAPPAFGERLADRIAGIGGSWHFILGFCAFLVLWILTNSVLLAARPPDPYPFILLNLILSCVAALQAPVIMMSQNRQESRDRDRAEQDYKVNLKAELEIRHLHEKIDHLLHHQGQRLLEIQQIQTELLTQLLAERQQQQPAQDDLHGLPLDKKERPL